MQNSHFEQNFWQFQKLPPKFRISHYCGILRLLEPACSVQTKSFSCTDNTGAELCGEILDVLWKETECDIVAVLHLLQKVLVCDQQSEYASRNTSLLNSLNVNCNSLGMPYLSLGVSQPAPVPVGRK